MSSDGLFPFCSATRCYGWQAGGNLKFLSAMVLVVKAFGATGFFFEIHPNPEKALSDGHNIVYLKDFEYIVKA